VDCFVALEEKTCNLLIWKELNDPATPYPHPELVEGWVWAQAPVLGIGGRSQPTSFDKLRMRAMDGGTTMIMQNQ